MMFSSREMLLISNCLFWIVLQKTFRQTRVNSVCLGQSPQGPGSQVGIGEALQEAALASRPD
ncbi:hypothetical protein A9K65_013835 [Mesorhizobium sp. WSM1497]|nr:hypothetical protein A9K65_013835 [Mesorhizobium sp. WSM1497]